MSPPQPPPDEAGDKKIRLLEDLFTLLCIFALWPVILGWREPIYRFALYIALAGLVIIFLRRIKRFRRARRELEDH